MLVVKVVLAMKTKVAEQGGVDPASDPDPNLENNPDPDQDMT